jgi:hypothetical protein
MRVNKKDRRQGRQQLDRQHQQQEAKKQQKAKGVKAAR